MKTKHLFLATALMASFAACTNEEIVSDVQQNVATGRPTVENVKLTFGENVDSRLVYNKGYKWESTDVIGALLMDNVNEGGTNANGWHNIDATWAEKYTLTEHIHTSYPFTYNTEDKTWGTPAKMLEGNYFFAFPFESYGGQRQVAHSLIGQEQVGIEADVRAESYANNQFFIGYDRIVAGTQAEEALNNVTMTPVLGAIQLQIVNTGTQDYHINKVVLKGDQLASVLTFDPTDAEYKVKTKKYNLPDTDSFNSANYLGLEDEKDIYNADENYIAEDALLAVIDELSSDYDKFSQLYIKGTEEERLLEAEAGNTAYVLIMATPCASVSDLTLDIYTDEGVVLGIDLTKINKEINAGKGVSAVTSARVKAIGPDVVNTIKVQIDDNSFNVPTVMNVYNDNDLLQFLQWNANEPGAREIYAILNKNVTLTAEMIETLAINKSIDLFIAGGHEITLDAELEADILDAENLYIGEVKESEVKEDLDNDGSKTDVYAAPAVKVLGEIELTQTANNVGKITVAEGAELTINDKKVKSVEVDNYGTLTIGAATKYLTTGPINNYGEMTVAEEAIVKAAINNYNELTVEGKATNVTNKEEAVITMGEEGDLKLSDNDGLVKTEDGAKVSGTNGDGEIEYVEGAKISMTTSGIVYREVEGEVEAEPTGADAVGVTAWYVVGDIEVTEDAAINYVKVMGDYDIEVAAPAAGAKTLTIAKELVINGSTTTEGKIVAEKITLNEDAIWTNNGSVTGVASISNEKGEVENNGTIVMKAGTTANYPTTGTATSYVVGEWDGDPASIATVTVDSKKVAMEKAVTKWSENWALWLSGQAGGAANFDGNPYNFAKFVNCVNQWSENKNEIVTAYYKTSSNTDAEALAEANLKMFGADCEDFEPAEFKDAVQAILKGTDNVHLNAAKKALIDDNAAGLTYGQFKKYNNAHIISVSTDVYEDMTAVRNGIAKQTFDAIKTATNFNTAMALWVIEPTDIEAAIEATEVENWYMLESDDIVAVARLWKKGVTTFNGQAYSYGAGANSVERLKLWFNGLYTGSQTSWSEAQKDAWTEIKAYKTFIESLNEDPEDYTPAQITAAAESENN